MTAWHGDRELPGFVRLLNWVGRAPGLNRVPSLDPARLKAKARRRTGLHDFGDPVFDEGLGRLCESLQTEARLTLMGRLALDSRLTSFLEARLRIQHARDTESSAVIEPWFITGVPRTGTSILQYLIARDPAASSPTFWESMSPWEAIAGGKAAERARRRATSDLEFFFKLSPAMRSIHFMAADLPHECVEYLAQSFASSSYSTMYDVPSYARWLEQADVIHAYDLHRSIISRLAGRTDSTRWILKAPAHLANLDALFAVYPDARVIVCHRDLETALASAASLTCALRSTLSNHVDPRAVGPEVVEWWTSAARKAESFRRSHPELESRFVDVQFEDTRADPLAVVRRIYRELGRGLSEEAEERMQAFLEDWNRSTRRDHAYEASWFGIDGARMRAGP